MLAIKFYMFLFRDLNNLSLFLLWVGNDDDVTACNITVSMVIKMIVIDTVMWLNCGKAL